MEAKEALIEQAEGEASARDRKRRHTFGHLVQMVCHLYRGTAIIVVVVVVVNYGGWKWHVARKWHHSHLDRCKYSFILLDLLAIEPGNRKYREKARLSLDKWSAHGTRASEPGEDEWRTDTVSPMKIPICLWIVRIVSCKCDCAIFAYDHKNVFSVQMHTINCSLGAAPADKRKE